MSAPHHALSDTDPGFLSRENMSEDRAVAAPIVTDSTLPAAVMLCVVLMWCCAVKTIPGQGWRATPPHPNPPRLISGFRPGGGGGRTLIRRGDPSPGSAPTPFIPWSEGIPCPDVSITF